MVDGGWSGRQPTACEQRYFGYTCFAIRPGSEGQFRAMPIAEVQRLACWNRSAKLPKEGMEPMLTEDGHQVSPGYSVPSMQTDSPSVDESGRLQRPASPNTSHTPPSIGSKRSIYRHLLFPSVHMNLVLLFVLCCW